MATTGDELVNPVTGLRTVFRHTAADSAGELLQVDWIAAPGWTTGPDHVHRLQAERFEVISGELGLRVDGVEHGLAAVIVRHYEDEIYFVKPPLAVQKLLFGPLAAAGRLFGYRPDYSYRQAADREVEATA